MKVVINTDDLALTYGLTKAVEDCYTQGLIRSASILVNGTAYDFAVKSIKSGPLKKIGVGIHLNLTDGPALTKELADVYGNYKFTFISLYKEVLTNPTILESIRSDFARQIESAISRDLSLDHIDSDKHVHMIPQIFQIACSLAKRYHIPFVRLTNEPFLLSKEYLYPFLTLNIVKNLVLKEFSKVNMTTANNYGLHYTDAVYGVLYTNNMTVDTFSACLSNALTNNFKVIEILIHPGYINDPRDNTFPSPLMEKFSQDKAREIEAQTLLDAKLTSFIRTKNIALAKFSAI